MPPKPHRSPRLSLILDFDGTLTRTDTLLTLASARLHCSPSTRPSPGRSDPWPAVVSAYLSDLHAHQNSYTPSQAQRTTFAAERKWLRSLRPLERASAARADAASVFAGVGRRELRAAAVQAVENGDVEMRPGWRQVFELCGRVPGVEASILSVNWSRSFAWECLRAAAARVDSGAHVADASLHDGLRACNVFANELPRIVQEDTSGEEETGLEPRGGPRELRTSEDKLARMLGMCVPRKVRGETLVVYVGDSATDLECLVAADVGVVVRDAERESGGCRELAATCDRIGLPVRALTDRGTELGRATDYECLWSIVDSTLR